MTRTASFLLITAAAVAVALPHPAHAQSTPDPQASQGPLVLEPIKNTFVGGPEYKATDIDGRFGSLLGGYAGGIIQEHLLIGGAVYTLANRSDDFGMTYGGALVGWTLPLGRQFVVGARGLVGVGTATLGTTFDMRWLAAHPGPAGRWMDDHRGALDLDRLSIYRARVKDDFFVFEPQVNVVASLTKHLGVSLGAGYRVAGYTDYLSDRLNGVTGSVALQIGGW